MLYCGFSAKKQLVVIAVQCVNRHFFSHSSLHRDKPVPTGISGNGVFPPSSKY